MYKAVFDLKRLTKAELTDTDIRYFKVLAAAQSVDGSFTADELCALCGLDRGTVEAALVLWQSTGVMTLTENAGGISGLISGLGRVYGRALSNDEISGFLTIGEEFGLSNDTLVLTAGFAHRLGMDSTAILTSLLKGWQADGISGDAQVRAQTALLEGESDKIEKYRRVVCGSRCTTPAQLRYFCKWAQEGVSCDLVQAAKAVCLKNLGSVKADYMAGIIKNWLSRGMTSVQELDDTGRKSVSADTYESSIDTEAWTDMVENFDPDMLYEDDE